MSDSDRDYDVESGVSSLDLDDNRARHNAQERERRDCITESLNTLRDAVPGLKGQKISRTEICLKAMEYIEKTVKRNAELARKCVELRRDNEIRQNKIRELAKAEGLDPEATLVADSETFKAMLQKNKSES